MKEEFLPNEFCVNTIVLLFNGMSIAGYLFEKKKVFFFD